MQTDIAPWCCASRSSRERKEDRCGATGDLEGRVVVVVSGWDGPLQEAVVLGDVGASGNTVTRLVWKWSARLMATASVSNLGVE